MRKEEKKTSSKSNIRNPVIILVLITVLVLSLVEVLYLKSSSTKVLVCNSSNTTACEDVAEDYDEIKELNPWIASLANEIVTTDEDMVKAAGLGEDSGGVTYEGLTNQYTFKIYINANEYTGIDTLKHEMYHLVDYKLADEGYGVPKKARKILLSIVDADSDSLSQDRVFKKMIKKNVVKFSNVYELDSYDVSSYQEAFVSMMLKYEESPQIMKKKLPQMYKYASKVNKIITILEKESGEKS